MDMLSVIAMAVAVAAILAAASVLLAGKRREKRCAAQEAAVAKAAQEYLARYQIRCRMRATTLPDDSMVLLVETPPHKKLRFSYIIEQPIRRFIRVHTGIEVARIFWRFPLPPKSSQVPEVRYADPETMPGDAVEAPAAEAASAPSAAVLDTDDDDNYFQHRSYQIEEVSWEDFSTLSGSEAPAPLPEPEKK